MNTSGPRISVSELRAALALPPAARAAGWGRSDLLWERMTEAGYRAFCRGECRRAARLFRIAHLVGRAAFAPDDPRRAAGLANLAALDRLAGREARARQRYAEAARVLAACESSIEHMNVLGRARSSLFHLRIEAKHGALLRQRARDRLRGMLTATVCRLRSLARDAGQDPGPIASWAGERPAGFDDARKLLAAMLLVVPPGGAENGGVPTPAGQRCRSPER